MWVYALWGLVGAAATRAVVFIEACQRAKGWPWPRPIGPGGGAYAVAIVLHLGVAAAVTAALSTTPYIPNPAIAFGIGAAAPVVVKKLSRYAQAMLPEEPVDHPLREPSVSPELRPKAEDLDAS